VADERLQLAPRDETLLGAVTGAQRARQTAPYSRAEAGVDTGDPPCVVLLDQLDLAGGDESGGVDVDHAVAEHVGPEQHLAGTTLELGEVELRGRRVRAARFQSLDVSYRDEQ